MDLGTLAPQYSEELGPSGIVPNPNGPSPWLVGLVGSPALGPKFLNESQPQGSRYLILKELGLKDHDCYGFWGLSP